MDNFEITITLAHDQDRFLPREVLQGEVSWVLDQPPTAGEVRLVWTSRTTDAVDRCVVQRVPLRQLPALAPGVMNPYRGHAGALGPEATGLREVDARCFTLQLPMAPCTFHGQLMTVQWAVEVELQPRGMVRAVTFQLLPAEAQGTGD